MYRGIEEKGSDFVLLCIRLGWLILLDSLKEALHKKRKSDKTKTGEACFYF